ncbi:hypothetical protein AGMMS50284_0970 [Clostridia bacterium]|nr:hypothetical protein AGMMS50284_0970 [Clostridia bacterium]
MTSTTLQNKKAANFAPVYVWTLLRHKTIAIVFSIFTLVLGPAWMFIATIQPANLYESQSDRLVNLHITMIQVINITYGGFITFVSLLFTLFVAVEVFGYLHSKRSMDTFGAMPVTRRTLFISRYFAGLTIILAPIVITALISSIIAAGTYTVPAIWAYVLKISLSVIAAYSFTAFLAVCCGTAADTVVSVIATNIGWPLTVFAVYMMFCMTIPGVGSGLQVTSQIILFALAPYIMSFSTILNGGFPSGAYYFGGNYVSPTQLYEDTLNNVKAIISPSVLIYLAIFTVVMFALSLFLIKKRKTEVAQTGFAFKAPINLIRFIFTVAGGMMGGALVAVIWNEGRYGRLPLYGGFAIGMVFGGLIVHILITLIYNRGFKGFVKGLISWGVAVVAVGLYAIIIVTGAFGAATYVPQVDKIEGVTLISQNAMEFTNKEDLEKIVALHKAITTTFEFPLNPAAYSNQFFGGYNYSDDYDWNQEIIDLTFAYKLKNGAVIERCYNNNTIFDKRVVDELKKLMASKSYREKKELFIQEASAISNVALKIKDDRDISYWVDNYEDRISFVQALKKDVTEDENYGFAAKDEKIILHVKLEYREKQRVKVGDTITYYVDVNYSHTEKVTVKTNGYNTDYYDDNFHMNETIEVKNTYKHTLAFLQEKYKVQSLLTGESYVENKKLTSAEILSLKESKNTLGTIYAKFNKTDNGYYDDSGNYYDADYDYASEVRCMLYDENGIALAYKNSSLTLTDKIDNQTVMYNIPKLDGVNWAYIVFCYSGNNYSYSNGTSNIIKFSKDDIGKVIENLETSYDVSIRAVDGNWKEYKNN